METVKEKHKFMRGSLYFITLYTPHQRTRLRNPHLLLASVGSL